ncbi:MAG: EAL domain-containing protein [Aeromonas molluscorum]
MSRLTSLWISLGLFCTPPLLLLLLTPLLTGPVTQQLLKAKERELLAYQAERNKVLEQDIKAQLLGFKFDCGAEDMALLRNPDYYSRHIRLAGLQPAQGKGCSTLGLGLPQLADIKGTPLSSGFGLTATKRSFGTEQELMVYVKHSGNLAYWILNNSWTHELLHTPCQECFYLEFTHHDPALEHLYFPRGNAAIMGQPHAIKLNHMYERQRVQQTLWAGTALRQYAAEQIRHIGLIIALSLGLLLLAGYWLLRNYRNSLDGLLKLGLQRREFLPFYQPIVDSRTHEVVGHEALIRWRRGENFIPPGVFIDFAERQGLIIPMTEQLVSQVVVDLKLLASPQWVSVNLVAAHVEQTHLQEMLLRLHWPDPQRLTFELTERTPISDMKSAAREMAALGLRGYHFKIDDFGTGYGGFAYLQQLGISRIKIDKMFIDTIGTQDLKRNVLDAIITFGHKSGMEMIAEGVENQGQLDYLAERGVYLIQGYVFAKPMPIAEIANWHPPVKMMKVNPSHPGKHQGIPSTDSKH